MKMKIFVNWEKVFELKVKKPHSLRDIIPCLTLEDIIESNKRLKYVREHHKEYAVSILVKSESICEEVPLEDMVWSKVKIPLKNNLSIYFIELKEILEGGLRT